MQFLSIGVNEFADDIVQCMTDELQQLKKKKIDYSINKVNNEGATSIICYIHDDNSQKEKSARLYSAFIVYVSNALAEYIIRNYEVKLVGRIINSNYCYFNTIEKKDILKAALKIIHNDEKNIINTLFQIRRKNIIIKKLIEYFDSSNSMILDGFVNFRLKDYIKDLEEVVDKAVDNFLMEREYKEFIRLLKYFVDIQEPRFNVIHVMNTGDNYMLFDEAKKEITRECVQDFINEISEEEVNYDDLLVSSLITLAPKKIIIHLPERFKNKELLETIKNVFSGKVVLCGGCDCCTNIIMNKDNN